MIDITLLYLGLVALILYWSRQEFRAGGIHNVLGWGLYMISVVASTGISYFIMMFSENQSWFGFTELLFQLHIIGASVTIILLIIFVIIDTFSKGITGKGVSHYLR
jgi:hypothetical protein